MIHHSIAQGNVVLTEGSTSVKFNMPDGEVMHVEISGSCDGRINAVYAKLFANLHMLVDQPTAQLAMVGQDCNVELFL